MPRKHIQVSGDVQGVGFRYYTVRQAESLGLVGWVRNCRDGSVEIEAQGDADALGRFTAAVQRGPASGTVADMDEKDIEEKPDGNGFNVRY